jgi:hypothetical protein
MPRDGEEHPDYSTLDEHARRGKTLVPPLMKVPAVELHSWSNDRLPEMLWAALLVSQLDRRRALQVFRKVAAYARERLGENQETMDVGHSGISRMPVDTTLGLLRMLCSERAVRTALQPLGLLADLPAREHWEGVLRAKPTEQHWGVLANAVAMCFWPQSQCATDCRWCRILSVIAAGGMVFPPELEEVAKEVVYYPDYGDAREAGPTIRAIEGALEASIAGQPDFVRSKWPTLFWRQCLADTRCVEPPMGGPDSTATSGGAAIDLANAVSEHLIEHCSATRTTTGADARHDAAFGLALFALSILDELVADAVGTSVLGRMGLRSLLECYITLAYLAGKDEPELWRKYRSYGTGQAKLAFLKLDRGGELPSYVSKEALRSLINEDYWQEFASIELGHWAESNLRLVSDEVGLKSEYDEYYPWTSAFAHGQWGAVRSRVYQMCFNPLHRFHRIPRRSGDAGLNDVVPDACYLVNKTLEVLDQLYPGFPHRVCTDVGD